MDEAQGARQDGRTPSIRSVWAATATFPDADDPALRGEAKADVAIVGGGLTGLAAALRLAESGREVIVLEAEGIGYGASGRNGGQVNPGLKLGEAEVVQRLGETGRGLVRMGEEATDFLANLVAAKSLRCGFVRPGLVRLAHSEPALKRLAAAERALAARGIAARLLSAADVEAIVGTRRYRGGLIDPRGGSLHPLDLVRELARVAREAGARIFVRSPVRRLSPDISPNRVHRGSESAKVVL
jgi:glycine/D-amino acid oxidase-like deaminating enzyme